MGKNKKKSTRKQQRQNQSDPTPAPAGRRPHCEDEDEGLGVETAPVSSSVTRAAAPPPTAAAAAAAAAPAAPVMECDVCQEKFDERSHKPRNLQCGHTFCSHCCVRMAGPRVQNLERVITCPKCRRTTSVRHTNDLPVNYPLLDMLTEERETTGTARVREDRGSSWGRGIFGDRQKKGQTSPHGGMCLEARAEVAMHCAHCDMWLCKDCSLIDHKRPECVLVPWQDTLKEMGQTSKARIRASQQALGNFYREVNAYGGKLSSCVAVLEIALDCIRKEQSQLPGVLIHCRKQEQDLNDIAAEHVPADVENALCYLDLLENSAQKTEQWVSDSTYVLKMDQVFSLSKDLLQTAVQMHTTPSGSIMGLHSINDIDVTLPMDMDGSRLLVNAAQRSAPTTGCRLVKLEHIKSCIDPSCALTFLDISLSGRELGRVFIRLLGSSKRSLCFLMMCTGETGPSFRNTRFHRVWWAGLPGEHLWTGDYDRGDGSGGSLPRVIQDQTKELSNEKTRVPVSAGLVAGRYGNNNSTVFRVYTRESTDVVEEFAFGRVEYGLQVFKDALRLHSIVTDLTISGCGVVVEP